MSKKRVCPGCGKEFDGTHGLSVHASRYCDNLSEEQIDAINKRNSGTNHPSYGHTMSEESKQELSKIRIGENNPMHGKTGEENPMYGVTMSEDAIQKSIQNRPDMSGKNNPNYNSGQFMERRCNECGEFYQPNHGDQKYCSFECVGNAFAEDTQTKFCEYCNQPFTPYNKDAQYCSVTCSNKDMARDKDMPNFYWAIRQLLGNETWTETKQKYEQDKCYKCGATENLHLHHIIPVMAGGTNEEYNLMTLCSSCHKKVEYHTQDFATRHLDVNR